MIKIFFSTLFFLTLVITVNCLLCEKYFSGIPFKANSKVQKENVTCSSASAYCINATTTFIKWSITARSCSDDLSIIQKVYPNFNECNVTTNCVKVNDLPLNSEATVCCCQQDVCNESSSLFKLFKFLIFLSAIQIMKYFLNIEK